MAASKGKNNLSNLFVTLFLCGDVMTGRGIDQVLPHPVPPAIYESYMKDSRGYIQLAERKNGPIPRPAGFSYVWGDALAELTRVAPDLRMINLETEITLSDDFVPKGINYRMSPQNVAVLTAAGVDFCALANNHVLDWGPEGLEETLETLDRVGIRYAGAGRDLREAGTPAIMDAGGGRGRVAVFAFGLYSSGIPSDWAAGLQRPGVNLLPDLSEGTVRRIAEMVRSSARPEDIVVVSLHWGGNWGYAVPADQQIFARRLIDEAGADVVYGHSSHHPKGIEVYKERLILYGCGDFLNDYEGISGYEEFRGDLVLMYFARLEPRTGRLLGLDMTPLQVRNFRLNRASSADARWLRDILSREGKKFGTRVEPGNDNTLTLRWD
jgi:poly-gamma-glutamate capsule biosynthesis protein CapA/YwtB (metallophosphatase superfamily)